MAVKRPRESSVASILSRRNAFDFGQDCVLYSMLGFLSLHEILRVLVLAFPKSVVLRNPDFWGRVRAMYFASFVNQEQRLPRIASFASISRMYRSVHTFRSPFSKRRVRFVTDSDSVAYVNLMISIECLRRERESSSGVYIEISVYRNTDSLSLCLVDFDGNGSSSLTFSPDAGAVIRERRSYSDSGVRVLTGEYCNILSSSMTFGCDASKSTMSVYVSSEGDVGFFRKQNRDSRWEICSNVTNCSEWLTGNVITPCVAFRDPGDYDIRIERVDSHIPSYIQSDMVPTAAPKVEWRPMKWEGDEREDINTFFVGNNSDEEDMDEDDDA